MVRIGEKMTMRTLEADYVVVGAGTMGLAFIDSLLAEADVNIILLDRRNAVGGHWRDAYPFVRLHSPSALYGVGSTPLGCGGLEKEGLNAGLMEMAGRDDIIRYFDTLFHERLLSSGRVIWLPAHDWRGDGTAVALADGTAIRLKARRRVVDATVTDTRTPASHGANFPVDPGVRCVPPHLLPGLKPAPAYVVVGAGKTAIDTVLWLLQSGTNPEVIRWIRPRDPWLMNRAMFQPRRDLLTRTLGGWTVEMEAAQAAEGVDDLFLRWAAGGLMRRLDPRVPPRLFHCAFVGDGELEQLRRVTNVVRLGRVRTITTNRILLENGEVPTTPETVHVPCTASGVPRRAAQPVFQEGRLVLHYVRRCAPPLSAALIAHVEATMDDDAEKNTLCPPVAMVDTPRDWAAAVLQDARTRHAWNQNPGLVTWLQNSRLDRFTALLSEAAADPTPEEAVAFERWRASIRPGLEGLARVLTIDPAPATQGDPI